MLMYFRRGSPKSPPHSKGTYPQLLKYYIVSTFVSMMHLLLPVTHLCHFNSLCLFCLCRPLLINKWLLWQRRPSTVSQHHRFKGPTVCAHVGPTGLPVSRETCLMVIAPVATEDGNLRPAKCLCWLNYMPLSQLARVVTIIKERMAYSYSYSYEKGTFLSNEV